MQGLGKLTGKDAVKKPWQYKRIMRYITGYWQFKAVILLIVVSTLMDVLTPAIIGSTIDLIRTIEEGSNLYEWGGGIAGSALIPVAKWLSTSFGYDPRYSTLGVFVASIVLLAAGVAIINYIIRYGTAWYSQKGSYEMRKKLYNSLLEQSFSFYDKQRTGQLMARATGDIDQIQRFYWSPWSS
jgi:ABC-type multidrug transport system fused ATPase/permease subunit